MKCQLQPEIDPSVVLGVARHAYDVPLSRIDEAYFKVRELVHDVEKGVNQLRIQ